MECEICCIKFNKKINKEIECCHCNKKVCKQCLITWCNEKTDIVCPFCNNVFNYHFCAVNIGKTFIDKQYKEIQKKVLFLQETDFIKDTQVFIDLFEKFNIFKDEYYYFLKNFKKIEHLKTDTLKKNSFVESFFKENTGIKMTKKYIIDTLRNHKNFLLRRAESYSSAYFSADLNRVIEYDTKIIENQKKIKSVCSCPKSDCRGFILSNDYKCGLCKLKLCKKCFHENDDKHLCNPNDVETVKLIMKESKPCPKCTARISKIEGCDQMYCVQCNTAFSWKTGNIETGKIHNPHYFEQLRKKGIEIPRDIDDNPDCRDPLIIRINPDFIDSVSVYNEFIKHKSIDLIIKYVEMYHIMLKKYRHNQYVLTNLMTPNENKFKVNYFDRIWYMQNKLDSNKFCSIIFRRFKQNKLNYEIQNEIRNYNDLCKVILLNYEDKIKQILRKECVEFINNSNKNYNEEFLIRMKKYKILFENFKEYANVFMNCKNEVQNNIKNICKIYKVSEKKIIV